MKKLISVILSVMIIFLSSCYKTQEVKDFEIKDITIEEYRTKLF